MNQFRSVKVIMVSLWINYSMEQNDRITEIEKKMYAHEVQCEERWKTCFQRLEDMETGLMRIESRMLTMGGTMIMFLAGVLVTLLTKI